MDAALRINLDSDGDIKAVRAGEELKGHVVIQVSQTVEGSPVLLQFDGYERTSLPVGSDRGVCQSQRRFVGRIVTLHDMSGQLVTPGTYRFPFSLDLPDSLPLGTSFVASNDSGFHIRYKLSLSFGEATVERSVRVAARRLPSEPLPRAVEPAAHKIRSMKWFCKGRQYLAASVENSQIGRGRDLSVSIAGRNESSVPLQCVKIRLVEQITWRAGKTIDGRMRKRERSRTLVKHKLKVQDLPGLDEAADGPEMSGNYQDIYEEIQNRLASSKIQLRIPNMARDSYAGTLVTVSHHVMIALKFSSVMVENASVSIPLRVGCAPATETVTIAEAFVAPRNHGCCRSPCDDERFVTEAVPIYGDEAIIEQASLALYEAKVLQVGCY